MLSKNGIYTAFARGLTFGWFAFTLLWLWADWSQLNQLRRAVSPLSWLSISISVWLSATAVLAFWEWLRPAMLSVRVFSIPVVTSRYARVVYAAALGFMSYVMTVLLNQAAPDIVYKAF